MHGTVSETPRTHSAGRKIRGREVVAYPFVDLAGIRRNLLELSVGPDFAASACSNATRELDTVCAKAKLAFLLCLTYLFHSPGRCTV